jgi:hypothetical protein
MVSVVQFLLHIKWMFISSGVSYIDGFLNFLLFIIYFFNLATSRSVELLEAYVTNILIHSSVDLSRSLC